MSSASIAIQIDSCRAQIDECKKEILRLENEIAELEKSMSTGDIAKDALIASIDARKIKIGDADTLQKYALTGNTYIGGMNDSLTSTKVTNLISNFEEKRESLRTEIINVDNELDAKKNELARLNGNLGDLEVQYQNAINQEAWDREQERLRNEAEWNRRMNNR